jgi:hypothetical protein
MVGEGLLKTRNCGSLELTGTGVAKEPGMAAGLRSGGGVTLG